MSASPASAPSTLVIKHLHGIEPATFQVIRLADAKTSEPAAVASPATFPAEGRPNSNLLQELQWHLENRL